MSEIAADVATPAEVEEKPAPKAAPANFKFKFGHSSLLQVGAVVCLVWQKQGEEELTVSRQFYKIKRILGNGRVVLKEVKKKA